MRSACPFLELEQVYHRRPHTETGQTPPARFETGNQPPTPPAPELLREAFLWSEQRTATATATVSMHANTYQVDPALIGRKVELALDTNPASQKRVQITRIACEPERGGRSETALGSRCSGRDDGAHSAVGVNLPR